MSELLPADQRPAFPEMKFREGPNESSVDCYDCDDADPYIDWQRQEIEKLRELLSIAQDRNAEHCAEVQRLQLALQEIASYPPGTLRPLADEIAIYKLATGALGQPVETSAPPYEMNDRDRAIMAKVQKAMRYLNNGDPLKDAIDDYEVAEALELLTKMVGRATETTRCRCGEQAWDVGYVEIRDSRDGLHYSDRPCVPSPLKAGGEPNAKA